MIDGKNAKWCWAWEDRRGLEDGTCTLWWAEATLASLLENRGEKSRSACVGCLRKRDWIELSYAIDAERKRLGMENLPRILGDSPEEVYLKASVMEESIPPGWRDVMPVPERDDDG